ncbi:hypothetical protein BJ742DRAFT_873213 [Cladochytrium replicatum]|nr:hypothetical protein BJ742DRAFT_873213 [Cladochytrium replicatum]
MGSSKRANPPRAINPSLNVTNHSTLSNQDIVDRSMDSWLKSPTDTNPTTTTATTRASIRYSGDLELKLPYDKDPLERPSNSFKEADKWFKTAEANVEASINNPSLEFPPPAYSSRDNKHFSIYFDNNSPDNKNIMEMWSKNPMPGNALSRSGTVNSNIQHLEYGNGTTYTSRAPLYKQSRFYLALLIFLSAIAALSLQANINILFGGSVMQNGKFNGYLVRANIFVSSLVGSSWLALFSMVWYYLKRPSLPRHPASFLLHSKLALVVADVMCHVFVLFAVVGTTFDVGLFFKGCTATATKLNFKQTWPCMQVQWSVGLAVLNAVLLAVAVGVRVWEMKSVGVFRKLGQMRNGGNGGSMPGFKRRG